MKKITILFFFLLNGLLNYAATVEESLQQAEKAYVSSDFQTAVKLYEEVLGENNESFEVFYNLGNAYFKLNQIAPAVLNYERAKKLGSSDDLVYNLQLANERLVDKLEVVPEFFLFTWYQSFVSKLSATVWGIVSVLFFITGLVVLFLYLFISKKRNYVLVLLLAFVLSLLTYLLGNSNYAYIYEKQQAIVFSPTATAQSVPGDAGSDLFVIHAGLKVTVLDQQGDWYRIKLSNGSIGWLKQEALEVI
ncbi:MAG: SH3 domain-containing protein [Cyclobacteriaceae bacterium]